MELLKTLFYIDYLQLFFDNPIAASVCMIVVLIPYFYVAFNLIEKVDRGEITGIAKIVAYIFGAAFVVANIITNLTAMSLIFRDVYFISIWNNKGRFKFTDFMISKRMQYYIDSSDGYYDIMHFYDWRDSFASFIIRIVVWVDDKHFESKEVLA